MDQPYELHGRRNEGWGTQISDYKIRAASRQTVAYSSRGRTTNDKTKRKQYLAKSLDEYARFEELVEADISDSEDDDDDLDDDDDEPGEDPENGSSNRTFTSELAQDLIDDIMQACGPVPTLDSIDSSHQRRIRQHDEWYMSVLDSLFHELSNYPPQAIDSSPFGDSVYFWMLANYNESSRKALLSLLLHPHVRSFRVRSAIGGNDWSDLNTRLESFSLAKDMSKIPSVVGTYFLHGQHRSGGLLSRDMGYVGQARSLKDPSKAHIGFRRRAAAHWVRIQDIKETRTRAGPLKESIRSHYFLWAHRRISHEDIEHVSMALLTVMPFPRSHMHRSSLHLPFLLTLAETIDMILLGTTSNIMSDHSKMEFGWLFGHKCRPSHLPASPFEGLNRALPVKQSHRNFGALMSSVNWTPNEAATFLDVIERNYRTIYRSHPKRIDWEHLLCLLEKQGIRKTKRQAYSLYKSLSLHPDSGLLTLRWATWRRRWEVITALKKFLTEKDLISHPVSDDDIYYHIPKLEGKIIERHTLRIFLETEGFLSDWSSVDSYTICSLLPSLLHKTVWEKINGVRRARHNMTWTWTELLRIWHQARAQLLSDGVPVTRLPIRGPISIVSTWVEYHDTIGDANILSTWAYDAWKDTGKRLEAPDRIQIDPRLFDSFKERLNANNEVVIGNNDGMTSEQLWPSDVPRLKQLEVSWCGSLALKSKSSTETNSGLRIKLLFAAPLAFGGSVSTFRVLVHLMQDIHKRAFDESTDSSSLDLTDNQFWECLYVGGLGPIWGFKSVEEVKHRFSWVLRSIRTGYLPTEAAKIRGILLEVLSGSLLKSGVHPYTYTGGIDSTKYLNPDLSPEWVEGLLESLGVLPSVQKKLEHEGLDMRCQWVCSSYGILITYIWEEAGCDYGRGIADPQVSDRVAVQKHKSQSSSLVSNKDSLHYVSKPVVQNEETTSSPGAVYSSGAGRKRQRPWKMLDQSTYSEERPQKRRAIERIAAMKGGIISTDIRAEDRETERDLTKEWVGRRQRTSMGGHGITQTSLEAVGELDLSTGFPTNSEVTDDSIFEPIGETAAQSGGRLPGYNRFTAEQDAYMLALLKQKPTWAKVAKSMTDKFGFQRAATTVRKRAKRLGQMPRRETKRYTKKEDSLLKHLLEQDTPLSVIASEIQAKFGVQRTERGLKDRQSKLGYVGGDYKQRPWTKEEDALLTQAWKESVKPTDVFSRYKSPSKLFWDENFGDGGQVP
ncbi:aminodeoxychorismate synthase [Fusarium subglutinans]|uniref:Aminodeoxychorismate synthase n=1 Tax=Gibberella subglutinans TaxID=42677 RepID=A0A8H5KJQ5_GIBSU|nr:aminodeoxychorismate synthase [Fusarium subglutinans]KAF5573978.1 aminodeoxychorismate synthase [Fusarium subglutinans]